LIFRLLREGRLGISQSYNQISVSNEQSRVE
jgi:hypothetical protein